MLDTELQISASKLALALVNDNKTKLFFNHQGKNWVHIESAPKYPGAKYQGAKYPGASAWGLNPRASDLPQLLSNQDSYGIGWHFYKDRTLYNWST